MELLTDTTIPRYPLQQSGLTGSSLYMIKELDGKQMEFPSNFLTPHRKDYYLFVFVKKGSSRHWVDMVPYTLKADTFYFTVPHQVHVKEVQKSITGTLLCFTDEFLSIEENEPLKQLPIIKNLHNGHELNLNTENVGFINDILQKMLGESREKQDWKNGMLLAYLRVLVIYLSRLYTEQFNDKIPEDRILLNKFRVLIEEQYIHMHDVAAYASLLNISAGHLGAVVKLQSGKNAIEHIHERILLEAKRHLFHTDNSVKEIEYLLGFEDSSYFNRFFKKLSEQTPLAYRNTVRKMYH